MNEELSNEVAEIRRIELSTRSLIIRLIRITRIFQDILIKLVSLIFNYNFIIKEKTYLHSLIKNNNNIIEELKNDYSNFFERIFIYSNRDFNT